MAESVTIQYNPADFENVECHCTCDRGCAYRVAGDHTKNAGRPFWTCAKKQDDPTKCKFFLWCDEAIIQNGWANVDPAKKKDYTPRAPSNDAVQKQNGVLLGKIDKEVVVTMNRAGNIVEMIQAQNEKIEAIYNMLLAAKDLNFINIASEQPRTQVDHGTTPANGSGYTAKSSEPQAKKQKGGSK